jgi:hypothetical protein
MHSDCPPDAHVIQDTKSRVRDARHIARAQFVRGRRIAATALERARVGPGGVARELRVRCACAAD